MAVKIDSLIITRGGGSEIELHRCSAGESMAEADEVGCPVAGNILHVPRACSPGSSFRLFGRADAPAASGATPLAVVVAVSGVSDVASSLSPLL